MVQWAINDRNKVRVLAIAPDPENQTIKPTEAQFATQLHFTTFNAPGITYVGGLDSIDRTTVVDGEHHVIIGDRPILSGDPIHLLGGPPVGGTIVGHRVNFAALGESGLFAHTIGNLAYWDTEQSPIVPYMPRYLDLGTAQAYAANFSKLANIDGSVTNTWEAAARLVLMLFALGVAFEAEGAAIAARTVGLKFDRDVFADVVASPVNGINKGLAFLVEAANEAGVPPSEYSILLASSYLSLLTPDLLIAGKLVPFITGTLVPFLERTATGIGNAFFDFLNKVPDVFDLGRTFSFPEYDPFEKAYAAALGDPDIDPALRPGLEAAKAIVDAAGQIIVLTEGRPVANPFDTGGFNPETVQIPASALKEGSVQVFTIFLPYAAGEDGQRFTLALAGSAATSLHLMDAETGEVLPQNGVFDLTIPEGQRDLTVAVWAKEDVDVNDTLSLSATLVDATGLPTHQTHLEATVALDECWNRMCRPITAFQLGQSSSSPVGCRLSTNPQTASRLRRPPTTSPMHLAAVIPFRAGSAMTRSMGTAATTPCSGI
jgi:hypothetical protein